MEVKLALLLAIIQIGLASPYTWSYKDWMNEVWKRWGTSDVKRIDARKPCETTSLKGIEGVIKSPNYPENYPNNADCKWVIETPKEYTQIRLEFLKFSVENPKWSRICFKDYVDMFQYVDGQREKKGKYCGKRSGSNITIYGNKVEIHFRSNSYRTKRGFYIKWYAEKGCGGDILGSNGKLMIPRSNRTERHFFCEWRIKTPLTHNLLELKIGTLSLTENYSSCRRSRLSVRDKNNAEIGRYCDSKFPHKIRIVGNEARVQVKISKKTREFVFQATWRSFEREKHDGQCGVATTQHERIRRLVGGSSAMQGTWPWMVQVRTMIIGPNYRPQTVTCGGVIISSTSVLTAAHCVVKEKIIKYEVLVGTVTEYMTDQKLISLGHNDVLVHPHFKINKNGKPENDLAIIHLKEELQFSHNIQPVCLPHHKTKLPRNCEFAGWGKTGPDRYHSAHLQTIPAFRWGNCDNNPNIACVTYQGPNSGACQGDSGSPLVCEHESGRKYVAGVLSYGATTCPSTVDGFVNIVHYLGWIRNTMKQQTSIETNAK